MKLAFSGAIALATTIAVLVPTAAYADSYVRPDATQDVITLDVESEDETQTRVPERAEGDIINTGVLHGKRRVKMAIRYSELTQTGEGTLHYFRINGKRQNTFVFISTAPGHWQGSTEMFRERNGETVRCRGMVWRINYATDLVALSVPRRCLGRPSWVKVGIAHADIDEPNIFADDAGTNGYLGDYPKWGPRVYR